MVVIDIRTKARGARSTQVFSHLAALPLAGRNGWLVECCFTSTETVGLLGTGAQDGHLDFDTAPEL